MNILLSVPLALFCAQGAVHHPWDTVGLFDPSFAAGADIAVVEFQARLDVHELPVSGTSGRFNVTIDRFKVLDSTMRRSGSRLDLVSDHHGYALPTAGQRFLVIAWPQDGGHLEFGNVPAGPVFHVKAGSPDEETLMAQWGTPERALKRGSSPIDTLELSLLDCVEGADIATRRTCYQFMRHMGAPGTGSTELAGYKPVENEVTQAIRERASLGSPETRFWLFLLLNHWKFKGTEPTIVDCIIKMSKDANAVKEPLGAFEWQDSGWATGHPAIPWPPKDNESLILDAKNPRVVAHMLGWGPVFDSNFDRRLAARWLDTDEPELQQALLYHFALSQKRMDLKPDSPVYQAHGAESHPDVPKKIAFWRAYFKLTDRSAGAH